MLFPDLGVGSSQTVQTWLFQTWFYAAVLFCALLHSFVDLRLRSFALILDFLRPTALRTPRLAITFMVTAKLPSLLLNSA